MLNPVCTLEKHINNNKQVTRNCRFLGTLSVQETVWLPKPTLRGFGSRNLPREVANAQSKEAWLKDVERVSIILVKGI